MTNREWIENSSLEQVDKERAMTREEAIEKLEAFAPMVVDDTREALDMAIEALEELSKRRKEAKRWKRKALQAEPKHGKWEKTEVAGGKIYVCSECSEAIYKSTFDENEHYYCNNCGAKMDKE